MKAYERGEYPQSVALLEQALKDVGEYSVVGGEVQLWLALAYQVRGAGGAVAALLRCRRRLLVTARPAGDLFVFRLGSWQARPMGCCTASAAPARSAPLAPPPLLLLPQAVGREEDCIELYKRVEANHPVKKIRQARARALGARGRAPPCRAAAGTWPGGRHGSICTTGCAPA
jgi:hypothetical protein